MERQPPKGDSRALLQNGFKLLEHGEFTQADLVFNQILYSEPENAMVYFGKLCAELGAGSEDELCAKCNAPITQYDNFRKAMQYGNDKFRERLNSYNNTISKRLIPDEIMKQYTSYDELQDTAKPAKENSSRQPKQAQQARQTAEPHQEYQQPAERKEQQKNRQEVQKPTQQSSKTSQKAMRAAGKGASATAKGLSGKAIIAIAVVALLVIGGIIAGIVMSSRNTDAEQQDLSSLTGWTDGQQSGDVLNDEGDIPTVETLVLSRVADGGTEAQISDEELYANAFEEIHNRHPFAVALEEYISGASETAAVLVDLNNDGIDEMVALRRIVTGGETWNRDNEIAVFDPISMQIAAIRVPGGEEIYISDKNYIISYVPAGYEPVIAYSYENEQIVQKIEWGALEPEEWYPFDLDTNSQTSRGEISDKYGTDSVRYRLTDTYDGKTKTDQTAEILAMTLHEPADTPSVLTVTIDGNQAEIEAYNIDGSDYIKLRDIAMMLNGTGKQFSVTESSTEISIGINQPYTPVGGELTHNGSDSMAEPTEWAAQMESEPRYTGYNIGGNWYFEAADMARLLDISIEFSS